MVENDDGFFTSVSSDFDKEISSKKKLGYERVDYSKLEKSSLKWCLDNQKLSSGSIKGSYLPVIKPDISRKVTGLYQDLSKHYNRDLVLEVSDNSTRVRGVVNNGTDNTLILQDLSIGKKSSDNKMILETADDDRVIGIPYTIGNVGADRYYVINGRIYTGWAMWFGLQAIRSPEDYARNVDLTYNVSFVWSGFTLKSQLSLGARFDVVHGTEEEETPEESMVKDVLFNRLKINTTKLRKTSFHLDMYGNAYWHIRRDAQGFPNKITILQPERIKIFLDPKTTKVLYYVYLPPILAGMALTPYPNVRNNPNVMHGPALTYPTPIVIDPQDIIHFTENNYTEYPFGLSSCKAMIDPCTARMDINILAPMIFKKYAKPMIHWRLDPVAPFQLTKGQIEGYIDGFKNTLQNMEPMSDPITTTRWSAMPIGAAQGKAELLTIIQDLDNQIFSCIGVPESYFKPLGGGDRMISEQDKTFLAAMGERQERVSDMIQERLVVPTINRYDALMSEQLIESGMEPLPKRGWNQYPTLQWRETFKQDQVTTIQNTMALLQAGVIDRSRAARRVGEAPPQESDELSRQMQISKLSEEVQIKQAELQLLQTQLQIMDSQIVLQSGGTAAYEMQIQAMQMQMQQAQMEGSQESSGGGGGGSEEKSDNKTDGKKYTSKDSKTENQKDVEKSREDTKYRVTFINRAGRRQTQVMKGTTLDKAKAGGISIEKITPEGSSGENPTQKQAKKALG